MWTKNERKIGNVTDKADITDKKLGQLGQKMPEKVKMIPTKQTLPTKNWVNGDKNVRKIENVTDKADITDKICENIKRILFTYIPNEKKIILITKITKIKVPTKNPIFITFTYFSTFYCIFVTLKIDNVL
jgi:hypothetical protein